MVVNPKMMTAAHGASDAVYLWEEAVADAEPAIARSALDQLVAEGADYDLEELVDFAYQERLAALPPPAIPPSPHQILHGLGGIPHELLYEKATEDVMAALDRYEAAEADRARHFGVEYRADTAPELAKLLKIDLYLTPCLDDLKHLMSGRTADGEAIPGKKQSATLGYLSLIFSPDKSISTVHALASPAERQAIVAAQRAAVDKAMHQIVGQVGFIRNRREGLDKRDPADMTWVQWQHRMSRRGDPQIHTHVSLLNVVRSRIDGKVGTMDTFLLHGFYPIVRETYHRALADELRKLDLPVEFNAKLCAAVISGIPDPVLRHFSGRKADAEVWLMEKQGVNFASLTPHQRSNWMGTASSKTRPPKAMYYVPGNGHDAWHARAAGQGYVPPPQFINPQALQRAGIAHAQVHRTSTCGRQAGHQTPTPGHRQQQQSRLPRPQLDARYNREAGLLDEGRRFGRSI